MNPKWRHSIVRVLCAVLMAMGTLLAGSDAFCSERDQDERQTGPTRTAEVTIQKKMADGLLTRELHRVRVSRYTEYVDQAGREMPYDNLAVPCKALLVYGPVSEGDPEAVSITVKKLLPGASRAILVVPE